MDTGFQLIKTVRLLYCPNPICYCQISEKKNHLVLGQLEPLRLISDLIQDCRYIEMRYLNPALSGSNEARSRRFMQ